MTKSSNDGLAARMATLAKKKINELRAAYTRTTGKPANRLGRDALIKTLASAPAEAPPAKQPKAATPVPTAERKTGARDPRLPAPGTVLRREYKGATHEVTVNAEGFTFRGKPYRSLTAVAKVVTGYPSISGTAFFGVAKPATPKGTKE